MSEDARIAILTQHASAARAGGLEVFNECLQDAFGRVEIFTDVGAVRRFGDLGRVGLEEPVAALQAARVLLRRHREQPFDIIVSNGLYGWPLTLARPGIPLVQVYHCTIAGLARRAIPLRSERFTRGHIMALFERIAGLGKHVVVVSPRVLGEVELFYGLKGRLISLGVDTDAFRPMESDSARRTLGLPRGVPIGLFVGRPDYTKGFDVLLRVARRMPHVLFLVAGGPGKGDLGNVRAVGRIAHRDLVRWYAACDFFFLPSRYEGFGLATLEALSCDIPVVVSDAAWPFREEPTQCGVVVGSDSEHGFVAAIRMVLAERNRFSPREFVLPRYDVAIFQRMWRDFLNSLVDGSQPSPRKWREDFAGRGLSFHEKRRDD